MWIPPIDLTDPCGVDPLFGDLAAFDRPLTDPHEVGLRVRDNTANPDWTEDQGPSQPAPPGLARARWRGPQAGSSCCMLATLRRG